VTVCFKGEIVAFVIGWNLILEYAIGTASVARGYSGYLDSLLNKSMEHAFRSAMPINVISTIETLTPPPRHHHTHKKPIHFFCLRYIHTRVARFGTTHQNGEKYTK
jgi:amino acid transporter